MPNINDTSNFSRVTLPIIFVIDSSSSSQGYPMALINKMMKSCLNCFAISDMSSDFNIKLGILKFDIDCEWMTGCHLMQSVDIDWKDVSARGCGVLSDAIRELSVKMSRKGLLQYENRLCAPIVVFITNGTSYSLDEGYMDSIEKLWKNIWYRKSVRLVLCVDDISDKSVFCDLVGRDGMIIETGKICSENVEIFTPILLRQYRTTCKIKQRVI